MVGVGVAGVAIGATYVTGNPAYDAVGSIAVGLQPYVIEPATVCNGPVTGLPGLRRRRLHAVGGVLVTTLSLALPSPGPSPKPNPNPSQVGAAVCMLHGWLPPSFAEV